MRNLKLAFRTLFRTPFVTVVAILSLALGIGANAAIYSLFNEMLLRPLPVTHPDRLVKFAAPGPHNGQTSCNMAGDCEEVFSYPMFRDLERANTAFSGIAAHFLFGVNVAMAGQTAVNGRGVFVSGSYVPVSMRGVMNNGWTGFDDRRSYWIYLFGRLKPGATIEQARASINTIYSHLVNDVEVPLQKGVTPKTLAQFKAKKILLTDGRR